MKHWLETRQILDRLDALVRDGRRAALATVTGIRGSAYRHPGAKLLVADDASTVGNVSGGCLEHDVREVALRVLASGQAELRTYRSLADDDVWSVGLGCEGEVDIFIEPAYDARPAERALLDGRRAFAVRTSLCDGTREVVDTDAVEVADTFVDVFIPPPRLAICGGGADTVPLAKLAADVGFLVGGGAEPDYAVVMTHNFARDREAVRALLATGAVYIGVLGPRRRTERVLDALGADDVQRGRVHGPVGLAIGAYGAEQIAVAIVADLLSRVHQHIVHRRNA